MVYNSSTKSFNGYNLQYLTLAPRTQGPLHPREVQQETSTRKPDLVEQATAHLKENLSDSFSYYDHLAVSEEELLEIRQLLSEGQQEAAATGTGIQDTPGLENNLERVTTAWDEGKLKMTSSV